MIQLEICCGGYEDALVAERCGATRIELNTALPLGGLTAEIGDLYLCKERLQIPVMAMLRPRAGGFCYTKSEFESMKMSAEVMLRENVDGLVFGILTEERQVDVPRTKELTELAHSYRKQAVFHRAFDCVLDFSDAMEALLASGVDRVLTSGGAVTALEGSNVLQWLQTQYGSHIEFIAGGGIRDTNVIELMEKTGIRQIHSFCGGSKQDFTVRGNQVSFAVQSGLQWFEYECVEENTVHAIQQKIVQYASNDSAEIRQRS